VDPRCNDRFDPRLSANGDLDRRLFLLVGCIAGDRAGDPDEESAAWWRIAVGLIIADLLLGGTAAMLDRIGSR
jgi:hypothetical protein